MPVINRSPVGTDNNEEHHKAIIDRQSTNDKSNDASKSFVSFPIGSTVVVQWEDGGPYTHGSIEAKYDCNHQNRSCKIWITTRGKVVTCNRQHIKPTTISTEHYLQDQLCKQTKSDLPDNILAHLEKQPYASNIINNTNDGQNSCNIKHSHTLGHEDQDNNPKRGEENSEQKTNTDKSPVNKHSNNKDNGHDSVIRTR